MHPYIGIHYTNQIKYLTSTSNVFAWLVVGTQLAIVLPNIATGEKVSVSIHAEEFRKRQESCIGIHPSERGRANITVEFTISNENDKKAYDNVRPSGYLKYGSVECGNDDFQNKSCETREWYVKLAARDKYSGLKFIGYDGVQCKKPPKCDDNFKSANVSASTTTVRSHDNRLQLNRQTKPRKSCNGKSIEDDDDDGYSLFSCS